VDVIATGYPSLDFITRVSRSPEIDETAIIKERSPEPTFGGCGANIATGLADQGFDTGVAMVVGSDFEESGYLEYLQTKGVDTAGIVTLENDVTSRSHIYVNPNGEYQNFFYPGAAAHYSEDQLKNLEPGRSEYTLVTVGNSSYNRKFVDLVRQSESKLIWQLKADADAYRPDELEIFARSSWAIFMNRIEKEYLLKNLGLESVESLLNWNTELIFLTRGSKGSTVITNEGKVNVSVVKAEKVVDPTGAGDAFTAGVISGLLKSLSPMKSAKMGAVWASYAVEGIGAQNQLPNYTDIRKRYNKNFEGI